MTRQEQTRRDAAILDALAKLESVDVMESYFNALRDAFRATLNRAEQAERALNDAARNQRVLPGDSPSVFVCHDPEQAWIDDQAENAAQEEDE